MSQRVVTSLNWTTDIFKKISIKIIWKRKRDILVKERKRKGHRSFWWLKRKKRTRERILRREKKKKTHWERKD